MNGNSTQASLSIAGAIAAVVFAGATAGAGTAALLAAVSVEGLQSAAQIWEKSANLEPPKIDIGGMSVPAILDSTQRALTGLTRTVDLMGQELADGMLAFTQGYHSLRHKIIAPAAGEFLQLSDADASGLRQNFRALTVAQP